MPAGLPDRVSANGLDVRELCCNGCGETVIHIEMWLPSEGDEEPLGLPLELGRCECGGFWLPVPVVERGDARE
jgi:hypothetical protein